MPSSPRIRLPNQPALVAGVATTVWLTPDGEVDLLSPAETRDRLTPDVVPIVCHARATARRLDGAPFVCLDVLELFAFVKPARLALPTIAFVEGDCVGGGCRHHFGVFFR